MTLQLRQETRSIYSSNDLKNSKESLPDNQTINNNVQFRDISQSKRLSTENNTNLPIFDVYELIAKRFYNGTAPIDLCNTITSYMYDLTDMPFL